jgi:tetratricopeptide (TPR) repeat protein
MSNGEQQPYDKGSDPLLSQPGYIYHHQKPPSRSRYVRPTKSPPKDTQQSSGAIIKQTIYAHVVTFVIVISCMLVLMVLAVVIANKTWTLRQEKLYRSSPSSVTEIRRLPRQAGQGRVIAEKKLALMNTNTVFLHPETIERYNDALMVWPYLDNPWILMGQIYMRQNDYRHAQIALEMGIGTNWPSARLLNDLGVTHLQQKDYGTAQRLFSDALHDDPEYTPAYFNLALSFAAQGNSEKAKGYLSAYLSRRPDDAKALQEKAVLDAADLRYDDALTALQKALASEPDWVVLYFDAASVAALMNNTELSAEYLKQAIPLASVMTVYRYYQLPQFKNLRTSDAGKELEKVMADQVRTSLISTEKPNQGLPASHPMTSLSSP